METIARRVGDVRGALDCMQGGADGGINGCSVHIGLWPRLLPTTFIAHCPLCSHPADGGGVQGCDGGYQADHNALLPNSNSQCQSRGAFETRLASAQACCCAEVQEFVRREEGAEGGGVAGTC